MTVVVGAFSFWKHIVRVRSWREWKRTSTFLAVYTIAWILDFVVPVLVSFLIVLVLVPEARDFCFPPAPASLIDSKTGGVKKPASGVLASDDSITGAPEKHAGEAVEQEAHSFVNSISSLIVSTAAGKHPQGDPHNDTSVPDPTNITEDVVNAKDKAGGDEPTPHHDKTKKPVHETVWTKARPIMHGIADVRYALFFCDSNSMADQPKFVDTYERFGNALSPTPPFPQQRPRLILASVLLPVLLGSLFTTSYMLVKGTGFIVGFSFFGDPIIQRGLVVINRSVFLSTLITRVSKVCLAPTLIGRNMLNCETPFSRASPQMPSLPLRFYALGRGTRHRCRRLLRLPNRHQMCLMQLLAKVLSTSVSLQSFHVTATQTYKFARCRSSRD